MKSDILFLSSFDGCLNRLAQILGRELAPEGVSVVGLGLQPFPLESPIAGIMGHLGYPGESDISSLLDPQADNAYDLVVTLTAEARSQCPAFPGAPVMVYWEFEEPCNSQGEAFSDESRLREYVSLLRERISSLFAPGILSALVNQKKTVEAILNSLSVGVMAHDLQRRIFYFSPRAEKITGLRSSDVLGRDCHEVFCPSFCGGHCQIPEGEASPSVQSRQYPTVLFDGGGVSRDFDISVVPLRDPDGITIGALASIEDKTALHRLERRLQAVAEFSGIIGQDHKMQLVYDLIRDVGPSDFPVVVSGESGTGKELVANAIHQHSHRRDKPFVAINCGALPEGTLESELFGHVKGAFTGAIRDKKGRFEMADTGTIFLDEVGELSPSIQVKLLRVLQEGTFEPVGSETTRHVDVRIVSATNRNLRDLVAKGRFREDLFYRLAVVPIELPPLRERKNDIPLLVEHFLRIVAEKLGRAGIAISKQAMVRLVDCAWPGNVRQLQNAIQYAMVKCHDALVLPEHLPPEISPPGLPLGFDDEQHDGKVGRRPKLTLQSVQLAFGKTGGNKAKAARMLGVGRATLYNFLKEQGGQIKGFDAA